MKSVGGSTHYNFAKWSSYTALCQQNAKRLDVSLRTLDKALWQDGADKSLSSRSNCLSRVLFAVVLSIPDHGIEGCEELSGAGDEGGFVGSAAAPNGVCGLPKRQNFCVSGWIRRGFPPIATHTEHRLPQHHHCADWNFTKHCCLCGFTQCQSHSKDVCLRYICWNTR